MEFVYFTKGKLFDKPANKYTLNPCTEPEAINYLLTVYTYSFTKGQSSSYRVNLVWEIKVPLLWEKCIKFKISRWN